MSAPTPETLLGMMQQMLNNQHEMAEDLRDVKRLLANIEHRLEAGRARSRRLSE